MYDRPYVIILLLIHRSVIKIVVRVMNGPFLAVQQWSPIDFYRNTFGLVIIERIVLRDRSHVSNRRREGRQPISAQRAQTLVFFCIVCLGRPLA